MSENNMNEKKRNGITLSKNKLIIICVVILLLIAGGITVGLNWNNWFGNSSEKTITSSTSAKPDIDSGAVDWQGEQSTGSPKTSDGRKGIAIPGYKSITLKADTKEQKVNLYNPEANDCYFVMSLILPDGTVIWKSKMIPPGKGLYEITLDKTVSAGTYENSILKYECYKQNDELTKLNGSEVKLTLEVE